MKRLTLLLVLFLSCAKAPGTKTVPVCDPGRMTIEDGPLPARGMPGTSDAAATGRFELVHDGPCHRFRLRLQHADGALARGSGTIHGEFLRSFGIVRFRLPQGIAGVGQPDSMFADSTVAAAYVVHRANGTYFLDVHLAGPAKASDRPETLPGFVHLDLAVGGGAVPTAAPHARNVVVIEPRQGAATYPLVVRGYARTFESNVQAWISTAGVVRPATKTHTTAADWMTTWGEFEITIPNGPSGDVELFVGEESAKDGTPIGVTMPLRMP
jgi:hypothetical protein